MKTGFVYHHYSYDNQKKGIRGLRDGIEELRGYIKTLILKRY